MEEVTKPFNTETPNAHDSVMVELNSAEADKITTFPKNCAEKDS